jgi:hypothetical protein
VTATSNEDNTTTGQALVNVHVFVTVSPVNDTMGQGANLQYSASVIGAPSGNQGVNWSATCASCQSGQQGGAFDADNPGLFIAPGLQQGTTSIATTITATSNFDQQQFQSTNITVQQTDPIGKISNLQILPSSSCPADSNGQLSNGTCYSMTVSCSDVADITAYTKVNAAAATPKGTVLFLIGKGGSGLYDSNPDWAYGYKTVEAVYGANYNTVQISFGLPFTSAQPNGWLQGPGGVRRLACRYATVVDWVYNNPTMINSSTTATVSKPLCATASSGGSGALGYAVFEYGLAGIGTVPGELTMIEPTSGPVMTRLDFGCVCNNLQLGNGSSCSGSARSSMCFSPSEAQIIDSAYQASGQNTPTLCSNGLGGTDTTNANRFFSDSIDFQPQKTEPIPLPSTTSVNVRFGGADTTTAVPQGETWLGAVHPTPTQACSVTADHEIPNDPTGAMDIANDIIGVNNVSPLNIVGCQ